MHSITGNVRFKTKSQHLKERPTEPCYIIRPITKPTLANRRPAALPALTLTAPEAVLVGDAAGEELPLVGEPDAGVEAEPPAPEGEPAGVVVLDPVALAAAWKASNDFAAVGLIAKTIPCAQ